MSSQARRRALHGIFTSPQKTRIEFPNLYNRWILIFEIRAVESVLKSRQRGFVFFSKPRCLWILIGERQKKDKTESLYAAVSLQAQAIFNIFLTISFASVQRLGRRISLAMEYAH